jgi:hypothetical protein
VTDLDSLLSLNVGRQQPREIEDDSSSPLLITSTSASVAPITRADADTVAPGGNTVDRDCIVKTLNRTASADHASPAGRETTGGWL